MKLTSAHNGRTFENVDEPLQIEGARGIKILNPKIKGGPHCIEVYRSTDIEITGGQCHEPAGTVEDPDDPEGHNIIFNQCKRCWARGVKLTSLTPSGDKASIFDSVDCGFEDCLIRGPIAKFGTAAIIDGRRGARNTIRRLTIEPAGARLGVCGGPGHLIEDVITSGAIEVTGEYYRGTKVTLLKLVRVSALELYVHSKTADMPKTVDCNFGVINLK